jgi:hypothetical protein
MPWQSRWGFTFGDSIMQVRIKNSLIPEIDGRVLNIPHRPVPGQFLNIGNACFRVARVAAIGVPGDQVNAPDYEVVCIPCLEGIEASLPFLDPPPKVYSAGHLFGIVLITFGLCWLGFTGIPPAIQAIQNSSQRSIK